MEHEDGNILLKCMSCNRTLIKITVGKMETAGGYIVYCNTCFNDLIRKPRFGVAY
jgi:hypothetical protein